MTEHNTTLAAEGLPRRAFTITDVEKMLAAGILDPRERFELIRGEIVPMNANMRPHMVIKNRIARWFNAVLDPALEAYVEASVRLKADRVYDPDVVIIPRSPIVKDYVPIEEVRLAVEVSDTSLKKDLSIKAPDYALAGLPELWVVHVDGAETLVMTDPQSDGYGSIAAVPFSQEIPVTCAPGSTLRIGDLLA